MHCQSLRDWELREEDTLFLSQRYMQVDKRGGDEMVVSLHLTSVVMNE